MSLFVPMKTNENVCIMRTITSISGHQVVGSVQKTGK